MSLNDITFGNNTTDKSLISTAEQYSSQASNLPVLASYRTVDKEGFSLNKELATTSFNIKETNSDGSSDKPKRDMVNYEALEGHPYKIINNPNRK